MPITRPGSGTLLRNQAGNDEDAGSDDGSDQQGGTVEEA